MQEENLKTSLQEESKDEAVTSAESKTDENNQTEIKTTKKDIWKILQYVGMGLCAAQLIVTVVFSVLCFQSVLPKDIAFFAMSLLIFLCVLFFFLQKWRAPGIVAKVFSLLITIVLIAGCNYLHTTNKGIGNITEDPNKHTDTIAVYVKADSGIKDLFSAESLVFGVMKNEYGTVDVAVSLYEEKYNIKINKVVYNNAADLFIDLKNEDINVAICNGDMLELLAEAEGYEGINELFTIIESTEVTVEIKADTTPGGAPTPASGVMPTNKPTDEPVVTEEPAITEEPTASPEVTENPDATQEPTGTPTETPSPSPTKYALNYLGYDPYVPYTEYHTGNDHVFTILVNGVDQQNGFIGRGDVNIMVTVNTQTHQILLVTTPRDSYLPISCFDWQYDKLTHATSLGGVKAAMQTLTNLYGVNCDYYFRVNFGGVEQLIDAIGGVTVISDSEFVTCYGHQIYKGVNELNGIQALGFGRTRHGVPGGEPSRGIHQMEVIRACIEKCTQSTALLTNYAGVMAAAGDNMRTSIPESLISSLISNQIATMQGWDVVTYAIEKSDSGLYASYALKANAYMSIPDYNSVGEARDYYHQIYNDQIIQK